MDMATAALRPATHDDSQFAFDAKKAALGEYIGQTFGWDEDEQWRLHERRFCPSATRIIVSAGEDVGLVTVRREEGLLRLLQLFVLPEAQGQGIGSQVLAQVLDEARRAHHPVALRVLKSNPRAKAFYQRHGFAAVGETQTHHLMELIA